MFAHKEVQITTIAYEDMEAGDAIIFNSRNSNTTSTFTLTHPEIRKSVAAAGVGGKYCHGTILTDVEAGGLVAARIATAGTLAVKTNWTGTLNPGSPVYPGVTTDGVLDTTGDAENIIGMYVGTAVLPASDSGAAIEVEIIRLSAVYVE